MLKGISNFQTKNTIKKIDDERLNNKFVGVFPADKINKFINFKQKIHEKTAKYLFLTANTEDSSKEGKHWWSILDIEPKKILCLAPQSACKEVSLVLDIKEE